MDSRGYSEELEAHGLDRSDTRRPMVSLAASLAGL